MIGKKTPNPKKSGSKSGRVAGLTNYITAPENENSLEKCVHFEAVNFLTDDLQSQQVEMTALATTAVRSKDPIDHYVLSWQEGEMPTIEQAREAVEMTMKHLGLEGHQVIWGLHDDTDHMHVHIAVNRVDPETLKVVEINKGFQNNAIQQAAAIVEKLQGWKVHDKARFKTDDLGHLITDKKNRPKVFEKPGKQQEPTGHAKDKEIQTGEKSAQRIGIEQAAPIIAQATSWKELHAAMAEAGMQYQRKGSGAVVQVGNEFVKASSITPKASLSALQKRFGPYQPPQEIKPNEYHHHTVKAKEPYPAAFGKIPGNHLRNLSKCDLAHSEKSPKTSRPRVLHLDVRADRRVAGGLRREAGRAINSKLTPQPLKENQPGWNEYIAIRDAQKVAKTHETIGLQKRHGDERAALAAKQKAERDGLFKDNWRKGTGKAKNLLKSFIAVQQAAEKLELRERHAAERKALQAQYKPLPMYKQWREHPQIVGMKVLPLIDQHITRDKQVTVAQTLRSLTNSEDARQHITYQLNNKDVFRDEGRTIAVLDLKSDAGIAAALAVAQQKFGQTLELTGADEFKKNAVAVAVDNGLTCRFLDPELDKLREQLTQQKYQAERDTARAERESLAAEHLDKSKAPPVHPIIQQTRATVPFAPALTTADRAELARAEKQAARVAQREAEAKAVVAPDADHQPLDTDPAPEAQQPDKTLDVEVPAIDYLADIQQQIEAAKAVADQSSMLAHSTTIEADHDAPGSGFIVASNDEFVAVQQGQSVKRYRAIELSKHMIYDGIDTGRGRFAPGNELTRKNGKDGMRTLLIEEREHMQTEEKRKLRREKILGI